MRDHHDLTPAALFGGQVLFVAFLFALLQPTIPNPLLLEPATAWTLLCYAFAVPIVLLHSAGGGRWQMTPFDWAICAYLAFVLVTWPTSFNRQATSLATVRLFGQVAVFCAIRLLASGWPAVGRVVVAAFIVGIALLEWIATDFHLRYGLSERLIEFPSLEWNGRTGLGYAGAIEFALLVGIWQRARSWTVQLSAIFLMAIGVAELIFFYSRAPWIAASAVLLLALVMAVRIGGVRRYALALGIIVAVIGLVSTPYIAHLAKMVAGLEQGPEGGLGWRLGAWRDAVSVIRQHPFVGVGLGNYVAVRSSSQLSSVVVPPDQMILAHPHNVFLQQIAEIGIAGGLAYLALWAAACWAGWRTSARDAHASGTNLSVFYALVAITVVNLGENMFLDVVAAERVRLHTFAWILMAVVTAGWTRARPSDGQTYRTSGKQRQYPQLFAAGCLVLVAYNFWTFFVRETPAVSIEGHHRRLVYEFGHGTPISQAFLMMGNGLRAFDVQFAADEPLTLLVRCDLFRMKPEFGGAVGLSTWFATIKRLSGVEWRRITLPPVEVSNAQAYALRLQLIGAAPAADATPQPTLASPSDRGPRVAVIASQENILGGGSLFISDQRQLGSLSLRVFTPARTAYERFRTDVAPTLPRPLRNPIVEIIALIAFQTALATIVYSLLIANRARR